MNAAYLLVMQAVILFLELILLYLLSRRLTQAVFVFFLLLARSRSVAVTLTTILLFPGTVIHELSHLFTADIDWNVARQL